MYLLKALALAVSMCVLPRSAVLPAVSAIPMIRLRSATKASSGSLNTKMAAPYLVYVNGTGVLIIGVNYCERLQVQIVKYTNVHCTMAL